MIPWTKKYAPKRLADIAGQAAAIKAVLTYVRAFPQSSARALILWGPTGVGKTAIAIALANELGYELVELNASDWRDKESVLKTLKPATSTISLFGTKKLILVDEVDSLSGTKDRGATIALLEIINESRYPIILTADNPFIDKLKSLRKVCTLVELQKLSSEQIRKKLEQICKAEKLQYEQAALKEIAEDVDGDLRAAINDLQMLASLGQIDRRTLILWGREREENIFNLLKIMFRSFDTEKLRKVADGIPEQLDRLFLWIDQNLPAEYRGLALARAYRVLSDADIFWSRIIRWQYWRLALYAQLLATIGIQHSKEQPKLFFVRYKSPELLLKLYIWNAKRKKMQAACAELAEQFHTSTLRLIQTFWPFLELIKKQAAGNL